MLREEKAFFANEGIEYNSVINEGAFGKIYLVYSQEHDMNFALKRVPENYFNENEVDCMKHVAQGSIINLYKIYRFYGYVYLLMEYCPFDLSNFLQKHEELSPEQLLKFCHGILIAIKACHDQNIAHSDIKPSNFLIDKHGRIKVSDFGLSNKYDENALSHDYRGTLLFMAPEIFKKQKYNPLKADIWAIGVTFYYMATHSYPFFSTNILQFIKVVNNGLYPQYKIPNQMLQQVIARCLEINPEKRPTIDEILRMPYFEAFHSRMTNKMDYLHNTQSQNAIIVKPVFRRFNKVMTEHSSLIPYQKKRSVSNAFDVKKMLSK